jgi:hypothetical protein
VALACEEEAKKVAAGPKCDDYNKGKYQDIVEIGQTSLLDYENTAIEK